MYTMIFLVCKGNLGIKRLGQLLNLNPNFFNIVKQPG